MNQSLARAVVLLIIPSLVTIFLFVRYSCMRRSVALVTWLGTLIVAIATAAFRYQQQARHSRVEDEQLMFSSVFLVVLILFAMAFGIRLYRKWLDGQATEDERASGARGIRAWLSPANLIMSGLISVFAWQALGWSLLLTLVLTIGLLLLWPALNSQEVPAQSLPSELTASPTNASEREKVLALLEAGKITADESAELLHALSSSVPAPPQAIPCSRGQKLALAGAVLVLVGFFLPWFSFSPGAKLIDAMSEMGFPNQALEAMPNLKATVTARGGDIANGLGWLVLILGVAGPLLPHVTRRMDGSVQRAVSWLTLGGGGIVVLYLVSQSPSAVAIGLVLVLAGYICEGLGLCEGQRPVLVPLGSAASLVLLALMAVPSSARAVEPATLGIDDIIRGIEENQEAWKSQTSWMVRYTHVRERIQPPPGEMVEFPDVELVNARKGPALYIYYGQRLVDQPEQKHESWMLWKDRYYTERTGQSGYKQDEPAPQIFSYYWYPFGLSRDLFSDAVSIPEEAFNDPELSIILPRCLKVNKGEYSVRKNLDEIDGGQCHVLERPGKDVIWIDAKRGFNVRRRTLLQPSGNILAEFKATGWTEKTKGIWLPKRQLSVAFNFDAGPKEYQGKVRFVMTNTLLEARFNDLPDSFFEVPLPKGVTFVDRRKGKQ